MCAEKSIQTDVLVVGSGAVGVAASIEAKEAGAQVIVLEKEDHLGGAAAISGGGLLHRGYAASAGEGNPGQPRPGV